MADARAKAVLSALADIHSRGQTILDLVTELREPLGAGDIIDVGDISALTVADAGGASPSNQTVQSVTQNVLTLTVNLEPSIFAEIPVLQSIQNLNGAWAPQVAAQSMTMLRNSMDSTFLTYVSSTLCADQSATYVVNAAGDTIAVADILNARAQLLAQDGTNASDLVMVVHPYAEAGILSLSAFIPNFQRAEQGDLGMLLGTVYGIPVYTSNSVERNRAVACTAVSVTSNVATVTAANHGLEVGNLVTISDITTPLTTAAAIASTADANTFTVPLTAGDGAMADGVGTVTCSNCFNVMFDRKHMFAARQKMPSVRIVDRELRTSSVLQVSALWGRVGRAGRAVRIHTPGSSL